MFAPKLLGGFNFSPEKKKNLEISYLIVMVLKGLAKFGTRIWVPHRLGSGFIFCFHPNLGK